MEEEEKKEEYQKMKPTRSITPSTLIADISTLQSNYDNTPYLSELQKENEILTQNKYSQEINAYQNLLNDFQKSQKEQFNDKNINIDAKVQDAFNDLFQKSNRKIQELQKELTQVPQKLELINSAIDFLKENNTNAINYQMQSYQAKDNDNNPIGPVVNGYEVKLGKNSSVLTGLYAPKNYGLHPIEKVLFDNALNKLIAQDSAEKVMRNHNNTADYPNNVVVVDIFAREKNDTIKTDNDGYPEMHSIALWKKKDNEIVIIDPSNQNFSSWLCNVLQQSYNDLDNVSSIDVGQLYTPVGATGSEKNNSRDCTDIAVKIGFSLNELQKKDGAQLASIENEMIVEISNVVETLVKKHLLSFSQDTYKHLKSNKSEAKSPTNLNDEAKQCFDAIHNRNRQSSHDSTRKDANRFLIDNFKNNTTNVAEGKKQSTQNTSQTLQPLKKK